MGEEASVNEHCQCRIERTTLKPKTGSSICPKVSNNRHKIDSLDLTG